ncbi:MAG: hypothetical protein AAF969_14690, partial [Bacteroidota bacterium]
SALFQHVGLEIDDNVMSYIEKTTKSKDSSRLNRDSAKNVKSWKKRLSPEEITRIKQGTSEVWRKFYLETDW